MKINNDINEDYVSFKTAKKLVKAGFNVIPKVGLLSILYDKDGEPATYAGYEFYGSGRDDGYIPRPTIQMVSKWMYINFGLNIKVSMESIGCFLWEIDNVGPDGNYFSNRNFETIAAATENAIKFIIKEVIK